LKKILQFNKLFKKNIHLNAVVENLTNSQPQTTISSGRLKNKIIGIKENIHIKDAPISCASNILRNYKSIYDATVVKKIKKNGGIIAATTNMDEFAMGSSSEYSIHGIVKNPLDVERVAGGSSGGSAVAVATKMVDIALGSDTGGSIRQPAAFCGVYGLKPTYGRISRHGLISYASSFDQIGIFSNSITNMVSMFETIAGYDEKDSTSSDHTLELYHFNEKKYKIGIPQEYWGAELDENMKVVLDSFLKKLKMNGHELLPIEMPHTEYCISTYYILTTAEASSNLARYDGVQYGIRNETGNHIDMVQNTRNIGFGDEVKRRILLGTFVLSSGYYDAYFEKAQKMRRLIQDDFKSAFSKVDILLTPTVPSFPFKIGEKINDPLKMYLSDIFTVPMNLAGVPAINIPIGTARNNFPVSIQAVGNFFKENDLFNFSKLIKN
jgi:aspartyl-tRNA(Asn)/glutamyl-tRNA(Gln) amidotransferase subunit A